jgi:hypothetical protein
MTHNYYNTDNFPHFVVNHYSYDIYANNAGKCAAIPTEKGAANGHLASHFGDLRYVEKLLAIKISWPPNPSKDATYT